VTEYKTYLANLLRDALNELEEVDSWRAESRFREATFRAETRKDRIAVMGEPTRYIEVLDAATDIEEEVTLADGTPAVRSLTVNVSIWYAYKDADDYDDSSQAIWDRVITRGILGHLSTLSNINVDGNIVYISRPLGVSFSEVALSGEGNELAHNVTFQITFN
jgi:hypothetical protein